jgi:hypothetical protein
MHLAAKAPRRFRPLSSNVRRHMTPANFAEITRNVIRKQGFEDFQPTACFPERREVRVLADVPSDVDVRIAVVEWARGIAGPSEEFLVAFKSSVQEFTVVRFEGSSEEEQVFGTAVA